MVYARNFTVKQFIICKDCTQYNGHRHELNFIIISSIKFYNFNGTSNREKKINQISLKLLNKKEIIINITRFIVSL